jgi:heme/copper-type cytochrome/quinol oxidase subunit 2
MKRFVKFSLPFGIVFAPLLAFAQTPIANLLSQIRGLISMLIPILVSAAIAWFIYSLIKYMGAKDEEQVKESRTMMINAVIALFVILSLWGLIQFIQRSLGVSGGPINQTELPNVN